MHLVFQICMFILRSVVASLRSLCLHSQGATFMQCLPTFCRRAPRLTCARRPLDVFSEPSSDLVSWLCINPNGWDFWWESRRIDGGMRCCFEKETFLDSIFQLCFHSLLLKHKSSHFWVYLESIDSSHLFWFLHRTQSCSRLSSKTICGTL